MTAKEPHERTLTIEQPLDPKIRKLLKRGQKKRKAHRSTLSSFFKTLIDHDQGQHRAKADLFEILVLLAKTGSQTQESLAGRHGVKSEDLSEIISVMRRMGLVTASCKQEQVELTLTPRGKEITSSYLSDGAAY